MHILAVCLCRSAVDALGIAEVVLGAEVVKVNGVKIYITCVL